jgi:hypothetical protein
MDLNTVIDSTSPLKKPRRIFTAEFKHQLIQQCLQPDTSVAKVAMQHQINPPLLKSPPHPQTDFLPVILHSIPVRQEVSPPPAFERKALAHIRIPLHQAQDSAEDQVIEIDRPVESVTELLVLIQGLTQ